MGHQWRPHAAAKLPSLSLTARENASSASTRCVPKTCFWAAIYGPARYSPTWSSRYVVVCARSCICKPKNQKSKKQKPDAEAQGQETKIELTLKSPRQRYIRSPREFHIFMSLLATQLLLFGSALWSYLGKSVLLVLALHVRFCLPTHTHTHTLYLSLFLELRISSASVL